MRPLPRHLGLRLSGFCAAVLLAAGAAVTLAPAPTASADDGSPDQSFTIKDPRITESSGLAASRIHRGIYWTHNDSNDGPYVYAVDSRTGETVATVTMKGIGSPRDVEAISIGPDGDIYVGDIGDNLGGKWDHVWIYRFPEPKQLRNETVRATQFTVKYADGPRNAESMMVDPKSGRVYIASKNEDGGGLYAGPTRLTTSRTNVFRRIGAVPWVTDGAFSPDGQQLVLRSYFSARSYDWKNGRLGEEHSVSAPFQAQAESVTFTADGSALMFGSEGEDSGVRRVDVAKKEKPEREEPRTGGKSSPAGGGSPSGTGADSTGADDSSDSRTTLGAVVLAGVAALFFGFRRLRRKE